MIEELMRSTLYNRDSEKTTGDMVIGRKDIEEMKSLVHTGVFNKKKLQILMSLMSGAENKIYNVNSHEAEVIQSYYVWVLEICKVTETQLDEHERLMLKHNSCLNDGCGGAVFERFALENQDVCACDNSKVRQPISERYLLIVENQKRYVVQIIKGAIDLFYMLSRMTLSKEGGLVKELLTNSFKIMGLQPSNNNPQEPRKGIV